MDEGDFYRGEFVKYLVFETEEEKQKAIDCLEKWMNWFCYVHQCQEDQEDERMFEYFSQDISWIIKAPFPQEPKQIYGIAIRFKLYKRYIDEKPSQM
jgi:hypothetical protein